MSGGLNWEIGVEGTIQTMQVWKNGHKPMMTVVMMSWQPSDL